MPFLVMCLPWFVVSRPQFFFYVLPMTPFMALAAVYTLQALSDARLVLATRTGEVAIDPETGLPAISTRQPYRPVVMGLPRDLRGAVPLVLADARGRAPQPRRVGGSTSGCAAGTDQRSASRGAGRCAGGGARRYPAPHDPPRARVRSRWPTACASPRRSTSRDPATTATARGPRCSRRFPTARTTSPRPTGREYQRLAEAGYVMCRVDVRGTGSSEGIASDEYPAIERTDLATVIDWLATRDWSPARWACTARRTRGSTAIQIAMERPPALEGDHPDLRHRRSLRRRRALLRRRAEALDPIDYPTYMVAMNALPPVPSILRRRLARGVGASRARDRALAPHLARAPATRRLLEVRLAVGRLSKRSSAPR